MSGLMLIHVIISLIAIVAGVIVAEGLISVKRHERSTLVYMVTILLTSLTGFLFPFNGVTPGILFGIITVLLFIPTAIARYKQRMAGVWRLVFIVGSLLMLYLNCVVLIVQSFQKIPFLNALAPTGNEPPILAVQTVLLVAFLIVGFLSVRRFRPSLLRI
ncbi:MULTISPECIES: hypothetical protein [Rhizobium]|uniref:DUF2306 domain-containing protein n=1 Tax=Rhizobium paranaense TaxID=1650438 RepID=A0A7W9D0H3_9HYPH|nr:MULTISPECIES: hypothetical protein [Rhizobium]MBB5573138.1 hypothetical protein [Rhizobium paranaense]PST62177.1 hypothetical protein C9E91_16550 [Rhizobium sp. SEMIA4064]